MFLVKERFWGEAGGSRSNGMAHDGVTYLLRSLIDKFLAYVFKMHDQFRYLVY